MPNILRCFRFPWIFVKGLSLGGMGVGDLYMGYYLQREGTSDPSNNDIIRGKALWKQSHFMTYHRYTTHF